MANANQGWVGALLAVGALGAFWLFAPLAPEPLTLPLAVFSGPYGFVYYARFALNRADIWALMGWFFGCMVVCGVPAVLAMRANDGSQRAAFAVIAFVFWALSGLLAIGLMV